ncbi:MAG: hypothetical protein AAFR17_07675 [Pseudomonadota bacterium]
MAEDRSPYFIGFLPVPMGLRPFLLTIAAALLVLFAGVGLLIGATQDDPGPGAFRFDYGRQTVTGVLELRPYPLIRVIEGSEHVPAGRTLMLSGGGKTGVMDRAMPLDGQLATASGVILSRGDLDMLQVRGGAAGLGPAEGAAPAPETEQLGRWRLSGEICDGKCLVGAMRPGRGLAHKACANLCIVGGVPPVFVSTQPMEGSAFLLVAGPDGGDMPAALLDDVGAFIELEGEVERRGDLLILRADPSSLRVL